MKINNREQFIKRALEDGASEFITDIMAGELAELSLCAEDADWYTEEQELDWYLFITPENGEWDADEDWLTDLGNRNLKALCEDMNKEYSRRMKKFSSRLNQLIKAI